MNSADRVFPEVPATVTDVLPGLGMAYLEGDDSRSWTITKSTPGADLTELHPGNRVKLTVMRHDDGFLVSQYSVLD
jgi:hypothetical protein